MATSSIVQAQEQTNKHFWHSLQSDATPEIIWSIWTDVSHWKDWDSGLKDAAIEGDFVLNATGTITSLEDRKSKFKVVEYNAGKSYTIRTKLPLGSLFVKRYLTAKEGQTVFTHEVWFQGLTGGIFAKAFGPKFRKMLPEVLDNIETIATSRQNDLN